MVVNGNVVAIEKGQTLYDLLISKNYNLANIAVELNGEIVPKETYKTFLLQDDDKLEIVQFVGGG